MWLRPVNVPSLKLSYVHTTTDVMPVALGHPLLVCLPWTAAHNHPWSPMEQRLLIMIMIIIVFIPVRRLGVHFDHLKVAR
jgi:hypothetical protein